MARVIGLQQGFQLQRQLEIISVLLHKYKYAGAGRQDKKKEKNRKKANSNFSPSLLQCNYCTATPRFALGITNCECAAANRQLPLPVINMQNSLTAQTPGKVSPLPRCSPRFTYQ